MPRIGVVQKTAAEGRLCLSPQAGRGEEETRRERMTIITRMRLVLGALALFGLVFAVAPAGAQQPTSVNPTASAVKEDQLLRQLGQIQGRGTIPDTKSYTIEHPAGRDWRHFHQVTLRWIGAIAILGMVVLLVVFYLTRGMVRLES